jgi:hypothetical protein
MRQLFLLMRQGQQREGNLQSVAAAPSQRAATRPRYQINVTNSRRFIASPRGSGLAFDLRVFGRSARPYLW